MVKLGDIFADRQRFERELQSIENQQTQNQARSLLVIGVPIQIIEAGIVCFKLPSSDRT